MSKTISVVVPVASRVSTHGAARRDSRPTQPTAMPTSDAVPAQTRRQEPERRRIDRTAASSARAACPRATGSRRRARRAPPARPARPGESLRRRTGRACSATGAPTSCMISTSSRRAWSASRTTVATVSAAASTSTPPSDPARPADAAASLRRAARATAGRSARRPRPGSRRRRVASASTAPSARGRVSAARRSDAGSGFVRQSRQPGRQVGEIALEPQQRVVLRHVLARRDQPGCPPAAVERRAAAPA